MAAKKKKASRAAKARSAKSYGHPEASALLRPDIGMDDSVWQHLSGTVSSPFQAGEHDQVAVKVVDDPGNELMVVKPFSEAGA